MFHPLRSIFLAVPLVCLLCGGHAFAQSAAWTTCVNSTKTNPEWAECGGAEISRADARLNAAWKRALVCFDTTDPSGREAKQSLVNEERLWIQYKDAACEFYTPKLADNTPVFGREGQVLSAPICKAKVIEDRAKSLESLASDCKGR